MVMPLPPLLLLSDEAAYRAHWVRNYAANSPIRTFDGIPVRFTAGQFRHAFYQDSHRGADDKAVFARDRAERMDWIATVLADASCDLRRRVMQNRQIRRIAMVPDQQYAVIIGFERGSSRAYFVTAYVPDSPRTWQNMRSNPKW
jgi:hypothetical protein